MRMRRNFGVAHRHLALMTRHSNPPGMSGTLDYGSTSQCRDVQKTIWQLQYNVLVFNADISPGGEF